MLPFRALLVSMMCPHQPDMLYGDQQAQRRTQLSCGGMRVLLMLIIQERSYGESRKHTYNPGLPIQLLAEIVSQCTEPGRLFGNRPGLLLYCFCQSKPIKGLSTPASFLAQHCLQGGTIEIIDTTKGKPAHGPALAG